MEIRIDDKDTPGSQFHDFIESMVTAQGKSYSGEFLSPPTYWHGYRDAARKILNKYDELFPIKSYIFTTYDGVKVTEPFKVIYYIRNLDACYITGESYMCHYLQELEITGFEDAIAFSSDDKREAYIIENLKNK